MKRIAVVKYGGLAAGGTERLLQEIAIEILKFGIDVEFFYCDPKISPGSTWKHPPNDVNREKIMLENNVKLVKFEVDYKDLSKKDHAWNKTNFFEVFNEQNYDLVWTAKAGPAEYPFNQLKIPFVETITLDAGFDTSPNRIHSIHISNWQRSKWIEKGGNTATSSVLPIPVNDVPLKMNWRSELGINEKKLVIGFHQRADNAIASEIPFQALERTGREDIVFVILGGGSAYRDLARRYHFDCYFLDHDSSWESISKFLQTLDIYAHGRRDGETFGTVLAEAMVHALPIITHKSEFGANAHAETIGDGGIFAYDVYEYAKAIERLASDSNLRKKLGNRGLKIASDNYSKNAFQKRIGNILSRICRDLGKPSNKIITQELKETPEVLVGTRILLNGQLIEELGSRRSIVNFISKFAKFINSNGLSRCSEIRVQGILATLMSIELTRGNMDIVISGVIGKSLITETELLKMNGITFTNNYSDTPNNHNVLIELRFEDGSAIRMRPKDYKHKMMGNRIFCVKLPLFLGQRNLSEKVMFCGSGDLGQKLGLVRISAWFSTQEWCIDVAKTLKSRWHTSKAGKRVNHLRFIISRQFGNCF